MNSQEPKSPKVDIKEDLFVNFGTQNIGKTVVLYNDRKKIGVIVKSEPDIIYIQTQDGEVIEVTNQDDVHPILLSAVNTQYRYVLPENIVNNVGNNRTFIVCFFTDPQTREHTVLHGEVKLLSYQGKDILQITSKGSTVHTIDPQLIDIDFFVTEDEADITNFFINKRNYEIIDTNYNDRKLLCEQLLNSKSFYDSENFYNYFSVRPQVTKKLLGRMYQNNSNYQQILDSIITIENLMGTSFLSLLLDPGILSNLEEFLTFIKHDRVTASVLELRKAFSEQLGTLTVYRSMILSEDEYKFVIDHGIYSRAIYSPDASKILEQFFNEFGTYLPQDFGTDFTSEIGRRIDKRIANHNSTTISVSGYKVVAESVGYHSYKGDKSTRRLFTFVCKVPRINIIKMSGLFEVGARSQRTLKIGEFSTSENSDLDVEMFVPFIINKEWIQSSEVVDKAPIMWTRD